MIASLEKYFEYYSRPARIVSDRGTCFTSCELAEFLKKNNIVHVKNATASPQANSQVECMNRTITPMLSKVTEPLQHSDWTKMLVQVEYALNNTVSRSTKNTPSYLLYGTEQRRPIVDELTEFLNDRSNVVRDLKATREAASKNIQISQETNARYFNQKCVPARKYELSD